MDKVFMKSGHTGEIKAVDADPAELVKLMVAGWSQCEAPAPAAPPNPRSPQPQPEQESK